MSEMLELGTLLREGRERKGLSIDELSERIKLAPRTLAFIESGTKSELPHAVYVKGFVKCYAEVVGLDPEELGAMVDLEYKDELDEGVIDPIAIERKKSSFPLMIIVVILLVGSLAAAGYFYMNLNPTSGDAEVAPANVAVEQSAVEQEVAKPAEAQKEAEAVSASSLPEVKEEKPIATPEPVASVSVVAPVDVVQQEAEQAATQKTDASVVMERKLLIKAGADCWVEAKGDGYGRKEFLLRSGESYTVKFPKGLSVRLGNSGGITLTLDGKPYELDGKDGRVRTVQIAAS